MFSGFLLPWCIQLTWPCFRALTHCPHLGNVPEHLQAQKPVLPLPLLVLMLLLFHTFHTELFVHMSVIPAIPEQMLRRSQPPSPGLSILYTTDGQFLLPGTVLLGEGACAACLAKRFLLAQG